MGKKTKTPYNHNLDNIEDACGLIEEVVQKRYSSIVDKLNESDDKSISLLCEALEKGLTKREIAYIAAIKIAEEHRNPMRDLMEMMMSKRG